MNYHTRIAPSPTGMFHLGTARTAYFNWLAARASGGSFILRIDDTDAARNDDAYVNVILDAMSWLGLDYDGLVRQSDRMGLYRSWADALIAADFAYVDDADRDADGRAPVRLRPRDFDVATWNDVVAGTIKVSDNDRKMIDGLVLMRSDGSPTYNFASIVDDIDLKINLVIRGSDHTNNTIKQIAIADCMKRSAPGHDWAYPDFAHVGLIEAKDDSGKRKKMSKRDDAASLLNYRDNGYDPDAILNFLLRLGWSPSDANFDKTTKMIPKDMAIAMFLKDGRMRNSPALYDPAFLDLLNRRFKSAA